MRGLDPRICRVTRWPGLRPAMTIKRVRAMARQSVQPGSPVARICQGTFELYQLLVGMQEKILRLPIFPVMNETKRTDLKKVGLYSLIVRRMAVRREYTAQGAVALVLRIDRVPSAYCPRSRTRNLSGERVHQNPLPFHSAAFGAEITGTPRSR